MAGAEAGLPPLIPTGTMDLPSPTETRDGSANPMIPAGEVVLMLVVMVVVVVVVVVVVNFSGATGRAESEAREVAVCEVFSGQ